MNDKREVRRQRRRDANRSAILQAAETIFSDKGYGSSTMDDIAEEAQFSKATLYRYFEGKHEVFSEIVESSFREARERFAELSRRPSPAEARLRDMVAYTLSYYHRKRNIVRIFWMERTAVKRILKMDIEEHIVSRDKSRSIPPHLRDHIEAIFEDMCVVVRDGVESGEFRPVDPEAAVSILGAMVRGYHFRSSAEDQGLVEKTTDLLMDFFLNGIRKIEPNQKGGRI